MKTVHYVATLLVKRVEVDDGKPQVPTTQGYQNPSVYPTRKVGDVVTLTVRGSSLDDLKSQLKDHLLIVQDDLSIPLDDTSKGQTRG